MSTCSVCFDSFNKSTRAETKCQHCAISICRTCLQTYLLNDINDVPTCINVDCRRGWEREFLDGELTSAFRLKTYKEHREKVLADREKARLPSTQEDTAAYKQARQIHAKAVEDEKAATIEFNRAHLALSNTTSLKLRSRSVMDTFGRYRMTTEGRATPVNEITTVRAAFIKPCPAEDCKGFLSTAWKCGLCDQWTCPECHDLKGPVKDIAHTCDPTKIATARLLAREAKSCPKCGVQICKIEGCDQMWCTSCNTGFNWRTGKIADGAVHNPHYFEWLRSRGLNPTQANAPVLNCNQQQDRAIQIALYGERDMHYLRRRNHGTNESTDKNTAYLGEVWRIMREEEDMGRRNTDFNEEYRQLRVKYMAGELTEADWKAQLQRKEKDANFQQAKTHIRDVFVNASRDLIRQILTPETNRNETVRSVEELITYCNTCYETVSKRFNRKISKIKIVLPTRIVTATPPVPTTA